MKVINLISLATPDIVLRSGGVLCIAEESPIITTICLNTQFTLRLYLNSIVYPTEKEAV